MKKTIFSSYLFGNYIVKAGMVFIIFSGASCEKDDDVPLGTISVIIDGSKKSFNINSRAEWLSVEGGFGLVIKGFRGEEKSSNNLDITIASPYDIRARTYISNISGNLVQIRYNVFLLFFFDEFTSSSATVTITEINTEHVQGTFSSKLHDSGGSLRELRGGEFNVSF